MTYQKFLENFILHLTIITLQTNSKRAETLHYEMRENKQQFPQALHTNPNIHLWKCHVAVVLKTVSAVQNHNQT